MNCRQCGIRIPDRYLTLESFSCPRCGKTYYRRPQPIRSTPAQPSKPQIRKASGLKSFLSCRSMLLLIALVIGLIYIIAQFSNISSASNYVATVNPETAEEFGSALGTAIGVGLLMPHAIITAIAVIFNSVGWFGNKRWAALTAAILYAVGGVLGFTNFIFVLVPMILCFVATSKIKKARRK